MARKSQIDFLLSAFLENLKSGIDMGEFRVFPERSPKVRAPSSLTSSLPENARSAANPFVRRPSSSLMRADIADKPAVRPKSTLQRRQSAAEILKGMNMESRKSPLTTDLFLKSIRGCADCAPLDGSEANLVKSLPAVGIKGVQALVVMEVQGDEQSEEYIDKIMSSVNLSRAKGTYAITYFPKCFFSEDSSQNRMPDVPEHPVAGRMRKCFRFLEAEISFLKPLIIIFFGKESSEFLKSIGIGGLYKSVPVYIISDDPMSFRNDATAKKVFWNWLKAHSQYLVDASGG